MVLKSSVEHKKADVLKLFEPGSEIAGKAGNYGRGSGVICVPGNILQFSQKSIKNDYQIAKIPEKSAKTIKP